MTKNKSVCVESRDPFALSACCWFLEQLAENSDSPLAVVTNPRDPDARILRLARGAGTVAWDGRAVEYELHESDPIQTDAKPEPFRRLTLAASSGDPVDFIRAALEGYRHELYLRVPQNGSVPRWAWDDDAACWVRRRALARRPLDTLFLDGAQELLEDLRHFVSAPNQVQYAKLHVAPVRVYMLAGRAGAGKSSLIHCAASELGFGVARADADACVETAAAALPPRTFLVIEDVDCAFAGRAGAGKSPFCKLLAALDASGTAGEPLAVVLTTNHLPKLDQALRRRVDRVMTFAAATRAQCEAMFLHFGYAPGDFGGVWAHAAGSAFSTSTFQKFLVKSLAARDPLACLAAFDELVACADDSGDAAPASMFA
jgi:hypothetical protein